MEQKDCLYHANRLAELIKIKTVSSSERCNEEFARFLEVIPQLFPKVFERAVVENYDGSLLLCIKGKTDKKPIMLMNHYDVVEAGDGWKYPPYDAKIVDGKLWGRGTIDTKGGLYSMFEAVEELLESGFEFDRDVYLETSSNEETTGDGARKISTVLAQKGLKFHFVLDEGGMIVEEPLVGTYGDFALIGVGEKATGMVKFIAKSSGGHSSTPGKNSPLVRIAKFMVAVENKKLFKVKISKTVCEMFRRISRKMNSASAVTFIPVAVTVSFIANHAKDAVDINTAETKSMINAGMSFLVSFIVSLLFLFFI
jgi:carboxypeptidase PM20D1